MHISIRHVTMHHDYILITHACLHAISILQVAAALLMSHSLAAIYMFCIIVQAATSNPLTLSAASISDKIPILPRSSRGCLQHDPGLGVSSSNHLKIYVADLPHKYTHNLYETYPRDHLPNLLWDTPFGDQDPQGNGTLWDTNQFSLGIWFHKQIATSPLRVLEASEADVVFVPIFSTFLTGPR